MDDTTARAKFGSIYDQHRRAVFVYCLRRAAEQDALDALNETFAIVWRRIDTAPDPEVSLPWLYSTARGVISNQRRGRKRFARLIEKTGSLRPVAEAGPDVQVVRRQESADVIRALQRLRAIDREILRLHAWEELPHSTIAEVLGISQTAVDKRVSRALKRLREEIKRNPEGRSLWIAPERGAV